MVNLTKYTGSLFIFLLVLSACSKSGSPVKKPAGDTAVTLPNVDIYMAGNTNAANNNLTNATYWKNGAATILSDGLPDSRSAANAIALKGNDVYIGGIAYIGGTIVACYWKNGVFVKLANGPNTYVSAVTVSGNDVYMAGTSTDKDGYQVMTYWKNDIPTVYPKTPALMPFKITGIAVNGNDVYLSGGSANIEGPGTTAHSPLIATYWKNGVITQLEPDDGYESIVNGIAVNGNDVYAVGQYKSGAYLWKNNTATELATSKGGACDARAVTLNGADVYVSGVIDGNPVYWKNNIATNLKNGPGFFPGGLANTIAVNNTGVYVASGYGGDPGYITFWFNGQLVNMYKDIIGFVNGMVVVPR